MSIYHQSDDRIPYTYLATHYGSGKRYYGSRYRKGCHPSELGKKYFTSSKIIKEIIKKEGIGAFFWEVRMICSTPEQARCREAKFLKRVNAAGNPNWFNQHNGDGKFLNGFQGKTHKPSSRRAISNFHIGKPKSIEARQNMSLNHADVKGEKNPWFGKSRSHTIEEIKHLSTLNSG